MIIIAPGSHPEADKFWKEQLCSKPNGARTLGTAIAKNLADIFEPHYDMLITYASDFKFEIPNGVKKIAVIVHQNFPWVEAFKVWQRSNVKLWGYEVDYFCNEQTLIKLIREGGGHCYYLPRFIDTTEYPKPKKNKTIDELWFTNVWDVWKDTFDEYKRQHPDGAWISHGCFGIGDRKIKNLNRDETLNIVNSAKTVWSLGVSQLEAKYFGANVVSLRGAVLDFYDQKTIVPYTKKLLDDINKHR